MPTTNQTASQVLATIVASLDAFLVEHEGALCAGMIAKARKLLHEAERDNAFEERAQLAAEVNWEASQKPALRVFANPHYLERSYEHTNIVAVEAAQAPGNTWDEVDRSKLDGLTMLWIRSGVTYWGHL